MYGYLMERHLPNDKSIEYTQNPGAVMCYGSKNLKNKLLQEVKD